MTLNVFIYSDTIYNASKLDFARCDHMNTETVNPTTIDVP